MSSQQITQLQSGNLEGIPLDILTLLVTRFLSRQDIARLCQTSKSFNNKLCNPKTTTLSKDTFQKLWKALYKRDISDHESMSEDYREEYQKAASILINYFGFKELKELANGGYEKPFPAIFRELPEGLTEDEMYTIAINAAKNGHLHVIDKLIQLEPDFEKEIYEEALNGAVKGGNQEIVDEMIKRGAQIKNSHFFNVSGSGNVSLLKDVHSHLPNVSFTNHDMTAALRSNNEEMINYVRSQLDPNDPLINIDVAAWYGDLNRIKEILATIPEDDQSNFIYESASVATDRGHWQILEYFFNNYPYFASQTGFYLAKAIRNGVRTVYDFLQRDAPIVSQRLLEAAAKHNRFDIFEDLTKRFQDEPMAFLYGEAILAGYPQFIQRYERTYSDSGQIDYLIGLLIDGGQRKALLDVLRRHPDHIYDTIEKVIDMKQVDLLRSLLDLRLDLIREGLKIPLRVEFYPLLEKHYPELAKEYQKKETAIVPMIKRVLPVTTGTPKKTPMKTGVKEGDQPKSGYCHAKTQKGTWCSRRAQEGSLYCWQHQS